METQSRAFKGLREWINACSESQESAITPEEWSSFMGLSICCLWEDDEYDGPYWELIEESDER